MLKHTITHSWPSTSKEVSQTHWTFREELTVEDEIIMKGISVVLPAEKFKALFQLIHEGNFRLNKCTLHAKETVYWTGLNDELEKLILNCEHCLKYSHSKCKQKPSMSLGQEIPLHLWSKLVTDIFHFEVASYLLIVEHSSRFLVVCKLSSMPGHHVAAQCKLIFSEYGWP